MNRRLRIIVLGLCSLAALILSAPAAGAQTQEIKPKPPMYSYVADWQVPRADWPDMDKATAPVYDTLQKALDDGTIIGYGRDATLVHQPDAPTHDLWWSAMSLGGLIKTLDRIHASTDTSSATLNGSKHWDEVYVSTFYNRKPGPYKDAYSQVNMYQLKADAPDNGLDDLSVHLIVPVLEKLLADGTLIEYEIDTMAVHTAAPGLFAIVVLTPTPEGLDAVHAAISAAVKDHPLGIQAFSSETEDAVHRDGLLKGDGVYK